MLWTMVKNNLKLMFRSKLTLIFITCSPLLVIACLSNAFHDLLQNGYEMEHITVGYAVEEENVLSLFLEENADRFRAEKIILEPYAQENGMDKVKKGELDIFFLENDNDVTIYTLEKNSVKTEICQYLLNQFYIEYGNAYRGYMTETEPVSIRTGGLEGLKMAGSETYYGITEIVYFQWIGFLFLTAVIHSERKNRISQRYISAPTNSFLLYLGKFLPCEILCLFSTGISTCVSNAMFHIEWGNIPATVGIVLLTSLASVALGMVICYTFNNLAVSAVLLFVIVQIGGFLGGSFETYMLSCISERWKAISPIYYVNRTLVEYATMGHSDYTGGCILYLTAILTGCSLLGCLVIKRRMQEE